MLEKDTGKRNGQKSYDHERRDCRRRLSYYQKRRLSADYVQKVYDKGASYYGEFYTAFEKRNEIPFVDLGMAYISFARKEPKLFELLFLMPHEENAKSTYELVNGADDVVTEQIRKAGEGGTKRPDQLFMKIWIFIHGAACMAVSGDYDLDEEQSLAILKSCYKDFAG